MKSSRPLSLKFVSILISLPLVLQLYGCASDTPAAVVVSGAGIGYIMMQSHKRSFKDLWNDNRLGRTIRRDIRNDPRLGKAPRDVTHVNVTVFNGVVLLTGEVPLEDQIARIIDIAKSYGNSRQVINRIELAGKSNFNSRANDALLTAQVRATLLDSEYLDGHKIKVVTERANVYLMGIVNRKEADLAVDIARSISGVVRVVKVFEYL